MLTKKTSLIWAGVNTSGTYNPSNIRATTASQNSESYTNLKLGYSSCVMSNILRKGSSRFLIRCKNPWYVLSSLDRYFSTYFAYGQVDGLASLLIGESYLIWLYTGTGINPFGIVFSYRSSLILLKFLILNLILRFRIF